MQRCTGLWYNPCKTATEAVQHSSSMVKIHSAVFICKAGQAEETFVPVPGDGSCFHLPLDLPYIFPQISHSCNSWRWGSHQPPPAYTGHDSVLWHSPLQRRQSETQEITLRQKTKQEPTSWWCCCSLALAMWEVQVFCQTCNGFCKGSAVESRGWSSPGLCSCTACSTHRAENHLPTELCIQLQTGNPEAGLIKPNPSTVVTALSWCNIFLPLWS